MLIKDFMERHPDAKEKPLKYAVDSMLIKYHFNKNPKADIENSLILQDFVEDVNHLVQEIKDN